MLYNFAFIDIAYGCKAYNSESPRSRIPFSNKRAYNSYKSIISEVAPNDSGGDAMRVVSGWEITTDEMKNAERCVVATVYEESKKSKNLGEPGETAVTMGLMEVNPEFPYLNK